MKQTNFKTEIFSLSSAQVVADMRIGWNLGNTLDCLTTAEQGLDAEIAWGNPRVTRAMLEVVAAAGFGAVRIPVTWAGHFGSPPDYTIDPDWLRRVEEIVGYVLDCGMYAILNLHHDGAETLNLGAWLVPDFSHYEDVKPCFTALWRQIADHFKAYGDRLLFESMNEPHCHEDWIGETEHHMVVNRLNAAFVTTIRSSGGNNPVRHLLIPTYAASPKHAPIQDFILPRDDRLIVSVHAYIPTEFCFPSYDVTWDTPTNVWGSEADRAKLTDMLDLLADSFTRQGVPLLIGEFAAVAKPDPQQRLQWCGCFLREAAKRGIPCFWWDTFTHGETMGLLDRSKLVWRDPALLACMQSAVKE